jgi:two-component system sensor histidine kinase HydH
MMSARPPLELTSDELFRVLEAARAVADVSAEPDYDRVVRAVLRACAELSGSPMTGLYLHDEQEDVLVLQATHPPDDRLMSTFGVLPMDGHTGRHLRALRSMSYAMKDLVDVTGVTGEYGITQVAVVPVHLRRRPKGVLHVLRTEDKPFDAHALRLLEMLVELSSVYIENARLAADAQSRLQETGLLLEVARASASSEEIERSLAASAKILAKMIDASNAFVLVLDEGDTVLRGVATSVPAFREAALAIRIPMEEADTSLAATAVRTKLPAAVYDAAGATGVRQGPVEEFGEKSVLALPLIVRERAIGALVVDDTRAPRRWTPGDIERAELVASQLAISVANAQLYEELRASYSELEHAQEELVKRERLAAIGQLAATLAHEVRNPLGVMFNSLATMGKLVPTEGDASTLLDIMREEAQRLDRLVSELLDYARPRPPAFETESLRAVVEGAVGAARVELGSDVLRVEATFASDLPPLRLDPSMIRRAIVNLVVNAAQASDPPGEVRVEVSTERMRGRRFARLDVIDRGAGIAPEDAAHVFEPFFTTKATGTGLGLAVVKGIVESHHGKLELASTPGKGTKVSVFLPLDA